MKPKVFITGGERDRWAIREDYCQLKNNLCKVNCVKIVDSFNEADIIHSVWWEPLLKYSFDKLKNKRIICNMTAEPQRYMKISQFKKVIECVDVWISQSKQAIKQMDDMRLNNFYIPYTIDTSSFFKKNIKYSIQKKYNLPTNRYIVSNFHRDTEGKDLKSPKLVKGPDIFLDIVKSLSNKYPIHVLIAGPRRFWIVDQLKKNNIDHTYVGKKTDGDDMFVNTLEKHVINDLYNASNLHLISSRSEGGPRSTIEACASECKIISTPVGISLDILDDKCIYKTVQDAVQLISKDIEENFLSNTIHFNLKNVIDNCDGRKAVMLLEQLYKKNSIYISI